MTTASDQNHAIQTGSLPETGVPFSGSEYQRRVDAVIAKFESFGIDAFVATSIASLHYLTGYHGYGSYFAPFPLIVTAAGNPTYVVRGYEEDAIRTESWIDDVVTYTQLGDFAAAWADALRARNLGSVKLGLELGSWNLSPADVTALQSHLPDLQIVDVTRLVPSVAAIKSQDEIHVMRASMALTDMAVRMFYECIRPGMTELETAGAIADAMTDAGGTLYPGTSLMFGARTALPHGRPSRNALERNQCAVIEVAGVVSGYAAGLVRSAVLGRHAGAEGLHNVALEALAAGVAAIRPGAELGDVDAAVRGVVSDAGKSAAFLHRAGYQNGLRWSYRGNLSVEPGARDMIERGMTFHLPMILFERGQFGVGTSQTVVVTESGSEPLSATSPALRHVD